MWGDVLTGLLAVESLAERTRTREARRDDESLRLRRLLSTFSGSPAGTNSSKENKNDEEYEDEELQNPG